MYQKVINILNKQLGFSPKGARFIWKILIAIDSLEIFTQEFVLKLSRYWLGAR